MLHKAPILIFNFEDKRHLTLYCRHFSYCYIIFIIIILKPKNICLSRFATIYFLNHFPVVRHLLCIVRRFFARGVSVESELEFIVGNGK